MKKILYRFLPLVTILIVALLLSFFSISWINYLLITSVVLGVLPLILEIFSSFKAKKFDLEFPVVITIFILLFLGQIKIAATFVLLILLGEIFKEYILWRVKESIKDISKSLPNTAFVKKQRIIEVKNSDIRKGDIVIIKAGGRVPVDGILLSKEASFDESVITGESKPVEKRGGEKIVAGAINLSDYVIEMQAIDTSENSTIAQVHRLVEKAQSKKAPLSHFTSRYAEITSLITILLVIVMFFIRHDISQALALWVALVPVIFAIIVPVATTIGISLLAKRGILVKNAEALENLTKVNMLVFDKTGTLTKGSPEINEIVTFSSFDQKDLLQLTSSVEKYSEHHLAGPIVKRAKEDDLTFLPIKDIQILKGKGISAEYNKRKILIGNLKLMKEFGISISDNILTDVQEKEKAGNSAIFVALDKKLVGIIFMADLLREEAKSVLTQLKKMGFKLAILTGDNKIVANNIAKELGVTEIYSELLPEDKINFIKKVKSNGEKVIMVGDGINDAPALTEANVGIAMGLKGVDITLESSQVVLINNDLTTLPEIITSSQNIFKIIKNDLFIATTIHVFTALLVIFNVISILGSAIFHQVSSALVLLNTMRLFSIKNNSRGKRGCL
ncbi:MAG: hypothetical protein CO034_02590 [Parcubacteria group bacterium CG_4_9_14_0_2_um_filter_35_11]|nr:MAG: hypothetical protein COS98_00145 [Parcubacteria group bacterium CG07_land_8_20_14_0_80_35_11]PJC47447.1 MAG: hypothetical protein CO034_02590 [Parcubacteria group bacterium CG_4_9_14_0_2_um_filter_35_11]